ncbi:hypothetical protein M758_12G160200 [Ceratodon purpureus]|nr:hypothetical protein M758_12G160200 [Ceratodon purpureus]
MLNRVCWCLSVSSKLLGVVLECCCSEHLGFMVYVCMSIVVDEIVCRCEGRGFGLWRL